MLPASIDFCTDSLPKVAPTFCWEISEIGTGSAPWDMPPALRWRFRDRKLNVEVMTTRPAVRTYNIVFGEGRPVAAALIAVD